MRKKLEELEPGFYVHDKEGGFFVGECIGLGFFEENIESGDCSPEEVPIKFDTQEEADSYLKSWTGGVPDSISVVERKAS